MIRRQERWFSSRRSVILPRRNTGKQKRTLIQICQAWFIRWNQSLQAGCQVREISEAIEKVALTGGYVVNQTFAGHGIGKEMHEAPLVTMANKEGIAENELDLEKVGQYV